MQNAQGQHSAGRLSTLGVGLSSQQSHSWTRRNELAAELARRAPQPIHSRLGELPGTEDTEEGKSGQKISLISPDKSGQFKLTLFRQNGVSYFLALGRFVI